MGFGALLNPAIMLPTGAIVMMSHFLAFAADRRRLLVQFAIAASVAACVIAPWTYRNYRAFHAFVPLRSNFGLELCLGNNPRADGTTFATNKTDHPHVNPDELQLYKEMGEIRYMKLKQDEAMRWITANPRRFAILTGRRVLMFWFGDTIAKTDWSGKGLRDKFLGCLLGIGACGGLTWLAVIRHPYRWTFFAAMVGPMTMFAFTHVYDRYRYPIDGLQLLLSLELVSVVLVAIAQLPTDNASRGPERLLSATASGVTPRNGKNCTLRVAVFEEMTNRGPADAHSPGDLPLADALLG